MVLERGQERKMRRGKRDGWEKGREGVVLWALVMIYVIIHYGYT